jgi:hypothetical protein
MLPVRKGECYEKSNQNGRPRDDGIDPVWDKRICRYQHIEEHSQCIKREDASKQK